MTDTTALAELRREKEILAAKSAATIKAAEKRGGGFTAAERDQLKQANDRLAEIAQIQSDADLLTELKDAGRESAQRQGKGGMAPAGDMRLSLKHAADSVARDLQAKAADGLVGQVATAIHTVSPEVAVDGAVPTSVLDLMPVQTVQSPTVRYMRLDPFDGNAAAVARGGIKPETGVAMTPVDARLRVIATLSPGVYEYDLQDFAVLQRVVQDLLTRAVREEIEAQVISGDGTGENLTGVTQVSGVQAQAFETDVVTTVRRAQLALETMGYTPRAVVLDPTTWADLTLLQTTGSGAYVLESSPLSAANRTLFGVPVVTSTRLPAGKGLVLDTQHLGLLTDAAGVRVDWARTGDDLSKNVLRARAETRADLAVFRPDAQCVFDVVSA